jgi:hypothetical protein
MALDLCAEWQGMQNNPLGAVTYMLFAAEKGDITTIIGGIAPDWAPSAAWATRRG